MKIKVLLLLVLICSCSCLSQNKVLDSLVLELKKTKNDIDKTQIFNAIANEYQSSNPNLMLDYATKALQLSQKINYKIEEGNAYLNLGNANIILGNYNLSLQNFSNAQIIFEKETSSNEKKALAIKKGLAKAYGSMGIVFSEQSNYTKALQFYLKAIKIYEAIQDDVKCAKIYNNIGVLYRAQNEDFTALDYFIKALNSQEKRNDKNIGITMTNIGNCYLKQKNFEKALEYYEKAKIALEKNPNPRALGELYNNLGLYFKTKNSSEKAIEYWNLSLETFQSIDDKFGIADTYLYLGKLYFEQKKFDLALLSANKALDLGKELAVLEHVVSAEQLLSDIYFQQKDNANALLHFKNYSRVKDSLANQNSTRKSVEAEMNFEFEKREAIQKKEIEKANLLFQEASKRHWMQTFFTVLFVLLLVGIGFLIYNRTQLKKTLTLQKELAEYEQKALHLQMNPHFVFNCLGSISSFIVQNGTDSAIKYLSKFSKLMRLTLEYSKEALIPIDKEIESLQNYLELEQLRFNNKFEFTIGKSAEIEDDMAIPPLLLQPFVENAIIHGLIPRKEMGHIAIQFYLENQNLICAITDNGIGFNKSIENKENSVSVHKSMALDITKKRLQMIEAATSKTAKLEIEELIEEEKVIGTKVVVQLPIQYIT